MTFPFGGMSEEYIHCTWSCLKFCHDYQLYSSILGYAKWGITKLPSITLHK